MRSSTKPKNNIYRAIVGIILNWCYRLGVVVNEKKKILILEAWSLVLNEMDNGCYSWMLIYGLWFFVLFFFKTKVLAMDLCIFYLN